MEHFLYLKAIRALMEFKDDLDMDNMDGIIKVNKAIKILQTIE